ncbi:HlyD family efflux transporter periplasmic adaptor subunit [Rhodopirellula sp. P2]|uniref:HlyD family efflux transporter periplasmic adaptor subunit n=1 Tax=Rhodopirellula sp. P2 TaxID=2127060 RepID=UPI0023679A7B|nr:biotin/lipoyl-binding protein [Rhodopirellula sp. P2]WDQ17921.1 HlyD family efflux transporter periplasmic adaptor subunit [Rhodopirellula sp. P2]
MTASIPPSTHASTDELTPYQLCHRIVANTRADRALWFARQAQQWVPIGSSVQSEIDVDSPVVRDWQAILSQIHESTESDSDTILQNQLDRYRESSGAQTILILPLRAHDATEATSFLVLETFDSSSQPVDSAELRADWQSISGSLAPALQQTVDQIHASSWHPKRRLPWFAWAAIFVAVALILMVVQVPLRLPVEGSLEPIHQQRLFAPTAARVVAVHVVDGQEVPQDTLLVELQSDELDLQTQTVAGNLATAKAELAGRRTIRSDRSGRTTAPNASNSSGLQSSTHEMVLRERIRSYEKQLKLLQSVQASMSIRSEVPGQVRRWDEEESLVGRDVFQGQWLFDVVESSAGMIADLELSEQHIGHVLQAESESKPVTCRLRLRAHPDVTWTGEIQRVASVVHPNEKQQPVIQVIATVPRMLEGVGDQPMGSTVVGDVEAGRRSLAYVLFRPFFESLREIW